MKKYDFIVLGAGLAGLAFAKKISEHGYSVLVIEKENKAGGLSRSLYHNGFYLDFCGHRFHTKNSSLMDELNSLPDFKLYELQRKTRIYMFGKYLKYPFEIQNLLAAMPIHKSFLAGLSFITNMIRKKIKKPAIRSYKDWFVYYYGKRLYEIMCYPYTSKIWRTDPGNISADWANERFQRDNMVKLIKRIIIKLITLDFSSYSLEDDELAPDGGNFFYPLKGIQEMSDAFAAAAESNGVEIICSTDISAVSNNDKTVSFRSDNESQIAAYDHLISTIPINVFYNLQDNKDQEIESLTKELKYLDCILVFVFLNKEKISNDHWIYFPEKEFIFNRTAEFSNWSSKMCPKGKTSICFDITSYKDSEIWKMSDDELIERVISEVDRINYFNREDVFDAFVYRAHYAYPFYDLDYKSKLNKVIDFLEKDNVYLLGRTGIFRYNNMDNSLEMALELANNFIVGKNNKSIYEYQIKEISY